MSVNQGLRQVFFRAISSTTEDYNSDFLAAAATEGFTGEFNGVFIQWLQNRTSSSQTNLDGLKQEFADLSGAHNWESVGSSPIILEGCRLWLDASDSGTFTESGGLVSQWDDKSGNGNDVTASGGDRPLLQTNQQNGLPTINFDGTDQMDLPSGLFPIPNGDSTMFIISQRATESATTETLINLTDGVSPFFFLIYGITAGDVTYKNRAAAGGTLTNSGNTLTNYNIFRARRSGVDQFLTVNGGDEDTNASATSASGIDSGDLGASSGDNLFLTGNVAEVIIYNRSLSTTEVSLVESYLSNKWDIPIQAPNNIGGLRLWLDADDAATITSSGGAVSQWDDKSGNSADTTQGTGSAQPTTGVTTQNGRNVLDFDGGDYLAIASGIYSITNGPSTVFIVSVRDSEDATTDKMLSMGEVGVSVHLEMIFSGDASTVVYRSNATGAAGVSNSATNTNFNIFRGRRSGTTQALAVNGDTENTNALGADAVNTDAAIIGRNAGGSSFFLTGSIAEMLMYDRSLSTTEITAVETYLSNKWGISILTPDDIEGLQLWLDASDSGTITESSGSVSQWDDKSGNGNHATQGTGSEQPTTNVTTQNGKNVLDFDGGDSLAIASGIYSITNGPNTVFIVSKRNSEDATEDKMLSMGEVGIFFHLEMVYSSTASTVTFRDNAGAPSPVTNTATNTNFNIFRGRKSGTTQALAVNGGTENTNADGADVATTDIARIGRNLGASVSFLTGSIAEMLMYDRSLTTAEIAEVETYLSNKWSINI